MSSSETAEGVRTPRSVSSSDTCCRSCTPAYIPIMDTDHVYRSYTLIIHIYHMHRSYTPIMHTDAYPPAYIPIMDTDHIHRSNTPIKCTDDVHLYMTINTDEDTCQARHVRTSIIYTDHIHRSFTPIIHFYHMHRSCTSGCIPAKQDTYGRNICISAYDWRTGRYCQSAIPAIPAISVGKTHMAKGQCPSPAPNARLVRVEIFEGRPFKDKYGRRTANLTNTHAIAK
jgi:hypothetical protein